MPRSALFGRRIQFSGSISPDETVATSADVQHARELVEALTRELVTRGATFVLPVDKENIRPVDGLPICFDWLIWSTIHGSLARRPAGSPNPLVIAVEHHKNEEQIPDDFQIRPARF